MKDELDRRKIFSYTLQNTVQNTLLLLASLPTSLSYWVSSRSYE